MTADAIPALQRLRDDVVALCHSLSPDEWELPSDCAGWAVRDVVAHMSGVYHGLVDPTFMRAGDDPNDMEAGMEVGVAERRAWPVADVLAEYEEYSTGALANFAMFQEGDLASMEIPMGNLGTHPMHILANAFVFDAYCHLRNDLIAPFGPLDRTPPAPTAEVLGPIVTWMLAGLPQMCADDLAELSGAVTLVLEGPGGGEFVVGEGPSAATVTSTPDAFVRWGTKRRSWRDEGVVCSGDVALAEAFCDACNVI